MCIYKFQISLKIKFFNDHCTLMKLIHVQSIILHVKTQYSVDPGHPPPLYFYRADLKYIYLFGISHRTAVFFSIRDSTINQIDILSTFIIVPRGTRIFSLEAARSLPHMSGSPRSRRRNIYQETPRSRC